MKDIRLIATVISILLPVWAQTDLSGGVGAFIQRPPNPPARHYVKQSKPATKLGTQAPAPAADSVQNSNEKMTEGVGAIQAQREGNLADNVEDALLLGNAARDAAPPRYEEAERAYRLAARLNPSDPRPYIGLGNILYDQKKLPEAAEAYRSAVALTYDTRIGKPLRKTGPGLARRPDSLSRTHGSATPHPSIRPPHKSHPEVVIVGNELEFERAAAEQHGQEDAYLGATLIEQNQFKEAAKVLKIAVAKNPVNADWHAMLGLALLKQKNYSKAASEFQKAVQLIPSNTKYKSLLDDAQSKREF